jgi:hypothetical protein
MSNPNKRRLWWRGALVGLCFTAAVSAARSPQIEVGEISVRACGADSATEDQLRSIVVHELEQLRLEKAKHDDKLVFSVSLVKFKATSSRDGARVSSVVSGTLRSAKTGAILLATQGSGFVENNTPGIATAKTQSLTTAVHGAVRHVPDVI